MTSMKNIHYKDASPQQTVSRIRSILRKLNIEIEEDFFNHNDIVYSCRIRLVSDGLRPLDIGTNGKGITKELALASGYAELMERLQNRFIANEAMRFASHIPNGESQGFLFFPDETISRLSYVEFWKRMSELFPNSSTAYDKYNHPSNYESYDICFRSLPFGLLHANNDLTFSTETVRLPIIPIRANSSTGMCAGNTPSEAILQGLCEIFERYVLQKIWLENITPPTIEKIEFSDTQVGHCLDKLEEEGFIYEIKDLSLNIGLPVIGLILTNSTNKRKMVRLGSDPDQAIALERCLTEIFQGKQSEIEKIFVDYSVPEKEDFTAIKYYNEEDKARIIIQKNYRKVLRDGSGRYPDSFFCSKPSYGTSEWKWQRLGDSRTTLHSVVSWLNDSGYSIYVRNNSFAGFCAYQIFVPHLSDQSEELMPFISDYADQLSNTADQDRMTYSEERFKSWPLYNIKTAKASDSGDVDNAIVKSWMISNEVKLFPYNLSANNIVDVNLLLFMYDVKTLDFESAVWQLSKFMARRKIAGYPDNDYLNCALSYFKILCECKCCLGHQSELDERNGEDSSINNFALKYMESKGPADKLIQEFDEATVNMVCSDFASPNDIMRNYKFPTCFNCDECPIAPNCLFENIIKFNIRINKILKEYFTTNPIHTISL